MTFQIEDLEWWIFRSFFGEMNIVLLEGEDRSKDDGLSVREGYNYESDDGYFEENDYEELEEEYYMLVWGDDICFKNGTKFIIK